MAPTFPSSIEDLGVQGCLSLAALLAAQTRIPVAPTRRMTLASMNLLREHGIIETPWPEARWPLAPAAEETPLEQLQWRYVWGSCHRDGLLPALEEYLQDVPRDDYGCAIRMRIWQELTVGEAERFFEAQLAKHNLEPTWAQDLTFVVHEAGFQLPIAQWRYCCWAATRLGAAKAQRYRGADAPQLREDMYAELKRRASRLASGDWSNCAFVPFNPVPESAISRLFTRHLTSLGQAFWLLVPQIEILLSHSSQTSALGEKTPVLQRAG